MVRECAFLERRKIKMVLRDIVLLRVCAFFDSLFLMFLRMLS